MNGGQVAQVTSEGVHLGQALLRFLLVSASPSPNKYLCIDFLNTEYSLKNARVETLARAKQVAS